MENSSCRKIIKELKSLSNPRNIEGMARFGISSYKTLGVPIPAVRKIAKETGKNHELALKLWASGIHEAKILASMIDEPALVTSSQMDLWAGDFDSWDVCDQTCMNLFDKTEVAWKKAEEWSRNKSEFVKRAGFAMMAALACHDKNADDRKFLKFLPILKRESTDERNFVKKAVNWALRQIGKRNKNLKNAAIAAAEEIRKSDSKAAKWIAGDAIRELSLK
ncbi:MAG: DNA alkylation repair protein [archaeon]